jgi:hypothetical protein
MNLHRMLALACGVTLAAAPWSVAQDKKSVIENKQVKKETMSELLRNYQQGGSYRFVSGDEVLTSGDFVSISRKGNEGKLTGVFVYSDSKSGKLFVRPKAGQPPVGVTAKDIDRIERIRPAVGTQEKGGVRPAIEAGGDKQAPNYEIHTMAVRSGPVTSYFYYDNSLSPAERDHLRALEKAGSDMVQKGNTIEMLNRAIENAAETPAVDVVQTGGPGYGYYPYFYPYVYPVAWYSAYYTMYYPVTPLAIYPYDYPYGFGYPGYMGGGGNSTVVIRDSGNQGQSIAALTKSLSEAQAALTEAQKNYVAVARRAVTDSSGRVVAVRLEE